MAKCAPSEYAVKAKISFCRPADVFKIDCAAGKCIVSEAETPRAKMGRNWRTLQLSPNSISRHLMGLYWCCVNLRAGKSMVLLKIKILCRAIKWTRKIIQTYAHPQNLPGTVEKGVLWCPEVFKLKIRPGKGLVYILGGHNVKKSRYMRTLRSCPNSAQRCIMMSWYVQNWNGSW